MVAVATSRWLSSVVNLISVIPETHVGLRREHNGINNKKFQNLKFENKYRNNNE